MWEEKIVKTRKDHKCEFCNEIIEKNSECTHYKGIYEGEFQNYYFCNRCVKYVEKHNEIRESISIEGFLTGDYWNWKEYYDDE